MVYFYSSEIDLSDETIFFSYDEKTAEKITEIATLPESTEFPNYQ